MRATASRSTSAQRTRRRAPAASGLLGHHSLPELQRAYGNQAVQGLIQRAIPATKAFQKATDSGFFASRDAGLVKIDNGLAAYNALPRPVYTEPQRLLHSGALTTLAGLVAVWLEEHKTDKGETATRLRGEVEKLRDEIPEQRERLGEQEEWDSADEPLLADTGAPETDVAAPDAVVAVTQPQSTETEAVEAALPEQAAAPETAGAAEETGHDPAEIQSLVDKHFDTLPEIDLSKVVSSEEFDRGRAEGVEAKAGIKEVTGLKRPAVHQFAAENFQAGGNLVPEGASAESAVPQVAPASASPAPVVGGVSVTRARADRENDTAAKRAGLGVGLTASAMGAAAKNGGKVGLGTPSGVVGTVVSAVVGAIAGVTSFVLSAIQGILDATAVVKSALHYRSLKAIADAAIAIGHPKDIVDAVIYAADRKYSKAIQRAVSFTTNAISVGVGIALMVAGGLALLAAGPAGWGVLGILAMVGLGIMIGQKLYGFWKGDSTFTRHGMSARLYNKGALGGDAVGRAALGELGLDPDDLKKKGEAARKTDMDPGKLTQLQAYFKGDHISRLEQIRLKNWGHHQAENYRELALELRNQADEDNKVAGHLEESLPKLAEWAADPKYKDRVGEFTGRRARNADKAKELRESAKKAMALHDEYMGEAEWKDIVKPERAIVGEVYEKLGAE